MTSPLVQKGALFNSGARGPQFHCFLVPFLPLLCHLNVGKADTPAPPLLTQCPPRGGGEAGASAGSPDRRHQILGLHRRVPLGFRTAKFPQTKATRGKRSAFLLPHPISRPMNGKLRLAFPTSPGTGQSQMEGGRQALGPHSQQGKGTKTSKRHTRFVFPSFNLKQKRHRGSKIKISFFPLPKPLPRSAPAPTPSSPAGAGEGKVQASPAGRGGGLGGGCQARCPSLSKYKYMFQNSWEILPRPPPKHSALARGVWRGAGAWGAPGTGWLWFTVLREPPAAHCKSGDTQGPHGRWGLPRSASRCWGSRTSTPHAARSETSCTEEREEKAVENVLKPAAFPSSLEAY